MRSECFKTFQKWVKISPISYRTSSGILANWSESLWEFISAFSWTCRISPETNVPPKVNSLNHWIIYKKSILGLSFPIIRNMDENLKLGSFLRMTLFDRNTWTEKYTRSNNISIFGMLHIVCPIDGRAGGQDQGLSNIFFKMKALFWIVRCQKIIIGWIQMVQN